MSVPKKRSSKSRRDRRRGTISLKKATLAKCSKCGKLILPHTICSFCGYYKGKETIDVLGRLDKKERKKREKEIKAGQDQGEEEKPLSWKKLSKK